MSLELEKTYLREELADHSVPSSSIFVVASVFAILDQTEGVIEPFKRK